MNFLGHFYLSGEDDGLLIGNFIADFVKGKNYENFPKEISKGILMHREIDYFTDNHPTFRKSKSRLMGKYRHYGAVIIDVFYDHFLAANFSKFHKMDLNQFAQQCYSVVEKYLEQIPEKSKIVFRYMRRDNWLMRYQTIEGIDSSLTGMSKRTKFNSGMELAVNDLKLNYEELKNDFLDFFDEIIREFDSSN